MTSMTTTSWLRARPPSLASMTARKWGWLTWADLRRLPHLILSFILRLSPFFAFRLSLRPWYEALVQMRMSDQLFGFTELTMLTSRCSDYPSISQGLTRIPGVNDAEELVLVGVSLRTARSKRPWFGNSCLIMWPAKFLTYPWGPQLAPCKSSEKGFLHRFYFFPHDSPFDTQNHQPAPKAPPQASSKQTDIPANRRVLGVLT